MHELWIAREILAIVQAQLPVDNTRAVKKITLEIGKLVMLDQAALELSFQVSAQQTWAQNARLEIIELPALAHCEVCQKAVRIEQYAQACMICSMNLSQIIQGEELRIKSMELE